MNKKHKRLIGGVSVYFLMLLGLLHFFMLYLTSTKRSSVIDADFEPFSYIKIMKKLEKWCFFPLIMRNISFFWYFSMSSLFLSVNIPDAAFIQATYRKCKLAKAQEDYISLDVKHTFTNSGVKKNSEDSESEPDDFKDIMPFTPKPQTLRQRMAEETSTYLIYL